jgi:hypothetical protein
MFFVLSIESMYGQDTVLFFSSQPGEYIGGGQQVFLTSSTSQITLTQPQGTHNILFDATNDTFIPWELFLAAPNGMVLIPGFYPNANAEGGSQPTLYFSGEGRGCGFNNGSSFTVLEAVYDSAGTLQHFAADFVQDCYNGPLLYGGIRFHTSLVNPVPVLNAVMPTAIGAVAAVKVNVTGANFMASSVVQLTTVHPGPLLPPSPIPPRQGGPAWEAAAEFLGEFLKSVLP